MRSEGFCSDSLLCFAVPFQDLTPPKSFFFVSLFFKVAVGLHQSWSWSSLLLIWDGYGPSCDPEKSPCF